MEILPYCNQTNAQLLIPHTGNKKKRKKKGRPLYQDFYSNEKIMCANHILMTLELQDMLHDKLYLQRHAVQKEELISQVKIEYKWY